MAKIPASRIISVPSNTNGQKEKVEGKPTNQDLLWTIMDLGEMMKIPIHLLQVDTRYQRKIVTNQVNRFVKNFKPSAVFGIVVAKREDGTYWIIDGQQRVETLRRLGKTHVAVFVLPSQGLEWETELFLDLNEHRTGVGSFKIFIDHLLIGDSEQVEINEIVRKEGFILSQNPGWPNIQCVGGLKLAYRKKNKQHPAGSILQLVLSTINEVWHSDPLAIQNIPIKGLADFIHRFCDHKHYNYKRLKTILGKFRPDQILSDIPSIQAFLGGSKLQVFSKAIYHRYNAGKSTRRLPDMYVGLLKTAKTGEEIEQEAMGDDNEE